MDNFFRILLALIWSSLMFSLVLSGIALTENMMTAIILEVFILIIPFCFPPLAYIAIFPKEINKINPYIITILGLSCTFLLLMIWSTPYTALVFLFSIIFLPLLDKKISNSKKQKNTAIIKYTVIFVIILIITTYISIQLNYEQTHSSDFKKKFAEFSN